MCSKMLKEAVTEGKPIILCKAVNGGERGGLALLRAEKKKRLLWKI